MNKIQDILAVLIGWPFIIIGWLVSVFVTSFYIGYEAFSLGEYKKSCIHDLNNIIEEISKKEK